MNARIVDKTYTAANFNKSAQILQAQRENNDNDHGTLQNIFGFPVAGKQGFRARYCLSLRNVGISVSDGGR